MTTTDHGPGRPSGALRLRLPHAPIVIRGDLPPLVVDALSDLTDERLHLDPSAPTISLQVTRADDDTWLVEPDPPHVDGLGPVSCAPDDADLLDALVGRLNRLAFHVDPTRLHLHAAALEVDGVGVLLAGASGSGKSTIAVELLQRGAAYLTDECLTIPAGSSTVFAYPKPITLKPGSVELFAADSEHPVAQLAAARNGRTQLRAGSIGATVPYTTVGVIVAVRHTAEEPTSFSPISSAEACVRLLGDSLDAVRMGPAALDVLAKVVAGATAWELVFRDAGDAAELIGDLRPRIRRQLSVLHRLTAVRGPGASGSLDAAGGMTPYRSSDESVRVVRFDDSAALHDGRTRSLVVLDQGQLDEVEQGDVGSPALARLEEVLGAAPIPMSLLDPWTPLAFGLPGRPVAGLDVAAPIDDHDVDEATQGRCTGVVVDQFARGRRSHGDQLHERARTVHQAGQSTCLLLERELPRLVDLLDSADASPVVLKGPVSAHDGPLPAHLRDFGDLDLLVRPEQIDVAVAALLDQGFERCFDQIAPDFDRRFAKSVTLRRAFSGCWDAAPPTFEVDLHRTLTPGPFGERVPLDDLHDHAVPARIHGRWYRALHPDHRFLHACLHVVLGSPEPRLHSVRDLITCAPRTPAGANRTLEIAEEWGVSRIVQQALELAESSFPAAMTPELLDAASQARPRLLERLYLASYHRPGHLYSMPAFATVVALPTWRDRRDFAVTHLRHRRSRREQHSS